jgi:hypothetical protein
VGTDSTGEQHVALEKRVRPPPHTASPTAPAEKEEGRETKGERGEARPPPPQRRTQEFRSGVTPWTPPS